MLRSELLAITLHLEMFEGQTLWSLVPDILTCQQAQSDLLKHPAQMRFGSHKQQCRPKIFAIGN